MSSDATWGYACTIESAQILNDNRTILIGRIHTGGRTDADVRTVIIKLSRADFISNEVFYNFPNLRSLSMQSVQLPKINKLRNCQNLVYIEAWYNKITSLDKGSLTECRNLTTLSLFTNPITRIESGVFYCNATLKELRLDANKINAIDRNFFYSFNGVSSLKLSGNLCVSRNFPAINQDNVEIADSFFENCYLNFEGNVGDRNILGCTMSSDATWGYACTIESAQVLNNNRTILIARQHSGGRTDADVRTVIVKLSRTDFIPNEVFDTFPNLKSLSMQSVQLPKINKLRNCQNLVYLEAWYNKITSLDAGSLVDCKKLDTLSLFTNPINRLDTGIFSPNLILKELRLDANKINAISRNFFANLTTINSFKLAGNVCINRNFPPINPSNLNSGVLPFFENCFRNYENSVAG